MKQILFLWLFLTVILSSSCSHVSSREKSIPAPSLDLKYASQAVALSLHCVEEERPHYYDRIAARLGVKSVPAKRLHPAFFGCFDWHSSVHGHWAMLRVLHLHPKIQEANSIIKILDRHLNPERIRGELAYFTKNPGFEAPYGYAWYLRLITELERSPLSQSKRWRSALLPLEQEILRGLKSELMKMNIPVREGAHQNTAFALTHAWDYAVTVGNADLRALITEKAKAYYQKDTNCALGYEPSSGDFISPCFVEADLMRRVLPRKEFSSWFDSFLPNIDETHLQPVLPLDPKDYILGHLIGLMYQKAASMRGVAMMLPEGDPRRSLLLRSAQEHAEVGWKWMFDTGYGGTHWIASFAIYFYSGVGIE